MMALLFHGILYGRRSLTAILHNIKPTNRSSDHRQPSLDYQLILSVSVNASRSRNLYVVFSTFMHPNLYGKERRKEVKKKRFMDNHTSAGIPSNTEAQSS